MTTATDRADPFRVLILSGVGPRVLDRLIDTIHREVPEARVCGLLYYTLRPLSRRERVRALVRNLRDPRYARHVGARVAGSAVGLVRGLGRAGLKFLHAYSPTGGGPRFGLRELVAKCGAAGCPVLETGDPHDDESLAFVRGLNPDLAIVYGTPILKPKLFEVPRLGSINIHQRKVPDYRGGGPIGLWEMLDDQPEIGVTVHRVARKLDAGAVVRRGTIPIEPFDTLDSLALKAHVVGIDLLARSVADFARGGVTETAQTGAPRTFRSPKPHDLRRYEAELAARRPRYVPWRDRSAQKLLARTLLLMPLAAARNWYRRLNGAFPVVVLYHHLVADRPHFMGIPTGSFVAQLEYLRRYYRVVDLETARGMLASGRVDAPTVVLTFDDGYKDNSLNLRAASLAVEAPATLFVCSRLIDEQKPFPHDLSRGQQGFPPLTWDETRELEHWGFRVESHTRTHFDCGSTDPAALRDEIEVARAELEERLGRPVESFSFPFGLPANISGAAMALARSTYRSVSSAYGGVNFAGQVGSGWHVFRCPHPNSLWELELTLQSILDLGQPPLWLGAEPPSPGVPPGGPG